MKKKNKHSQHHTPPRRVHGRIRAGDISGRIALGAYVKNERVRMLLQRMRENQMPEEEK
jgi:hypothetical protein